LAGIGADPRRSIHHKPSLKTREAITHAIAAGRSGKSAGQRAILEGGSGESQAETRRPD
jgi:hypothetical protein